MTHDQGRAEQVLLDYYERKQCSAQWSGLVGLFFDELQRNAGSEDAHAFLRHIGTRLAQALQLGEHDTMEGLEAAMNHHWQQLDWGVVKLGENPGAMVIRHHGSPLPTQLLDADTARAAMAAVLEGVYASWLEAQSGEKGIALRNANCADRGTLEFHYGH